MTRGGFGYEDEPLIPGITKTQSTKHQWNLFKNEPRKNESGSTAESKYLELGIKWLKFITFCMTFSVVLLTALLSKGSLLLMTSQVKKNITRPYCNEKIDPRNDFIVTLPEEETAIWIWMLIFAYCVPELGTFIRSLRICFFKTWEFPSILEFAWLFLVEALPAIGTSLLVFGIFPELDVVKATMLTNGVCFVPAIVGFFSRNPASKNNTLKVIIDILAILAQATALVAWPLVENKPILYIIPVSIIFISFGWCENYLSEKSPIRFVSEWARKKKIFENRTYFMYTIIAPIKCVLFIATALGVIYYRENEIWFVFDKFTEAFGSHNLGIYQIEPIVSSSTVVDYTEIVSIGIERFQETTFWTPLCIWLINVLASYICYAFGKFACKILIHTFSFALPVSLVVPVLVCILTILCGNWNKNECSYTGFIPTYLFFNVSPVASIGELMNHELYYLFPIWWLSQMWTTLHIWNAADEKLTSTEKLFFRPMYDAVLIDQSIALNRRREQDLSTIKLGIQDSDEQTDVNEDKVTRIYACGTMWHETKEEMLEFLKSILRMDEDQCAHRIVRNYLRYNLPNYYEFETHILFDDAFIRTSEEDDDPHINVYVKDLIESVNTAASEVHATNVMIKPPVIFPTPYGGRLEWILPGKTKMIAHLKDKAKIRPKKRWSQVMYMYYLLGYKIMDDDELSPERIKNIAENTYLLALDGDIDFQPQAVHLLVDYMKKNKTLGAACGRIHPVGQGAMAWYQIFEYAVGHWLQKATEHVIGCVLCSPGCFSLFRARALMDDNVMAKYTATSSEARHYIQYDQGEDRWLCTLLLQRGYRVEYSAASDAYTHCPEGFSEFYNQRRRWMPSTTANILDLLTDYKYIVKINDNISRPYIFYQAVLMIGTVIGPGTIFLMLIGAFVAAFQLDQWSSFVWNIVPILVFVIVCAVCKSDTQLFFAGVISAIYGLVMMAVLIGIVIQIKDDGWMAPSSLFFFCVAAEFIITALMHPQEFYCLKYGVIYYVTVPSMYMLLVIYSIFNMNNVSWGTREVTIVPKESQKPEDLNKPSPPKKQVNTFSLEYVTQYFNFNSTEKEMLRNVQATLNQLQAKLDVIERNQYLNGTDTTEPRRTIRKDTVVVEGPRASRMSMRNSVNPQMRKSLLNDFIDGEDDEDSIDSPSDDIHENSWFYDSELLKSEVSYLDKKEERFWDDVIEQYLAPIDDTDKKAKIAQDLKDLRDKMVMTFFMINSLFVLVVFMLTIQKDTIHVEWPISPKINYTYNIDQNEYFIQKTHLQLEPIGFVFLIFFAFLMGIQFLAMFYHRFGTYCQIMANTYLNWSLFDNDDVDNITEEQILKKDPITLFKKLIRLQGINDDDDEDDRDIPVTRRNTAHFLALKKERPLKPVIKDLEQAFMARMEKVKDGGKDIHVPRKSLAAIRKRRATVMRASQLGGGPVISPVSPQYLGVDKNVKFDNPNYEEENI